MARYKFNQPLRTAEEVAQALGVTTTGVPSIRIDEDGSTILDLPGVRLTPDKAAQLQRLASQLGWGESV